VKLQPEVTEAAGLVGEERVFLNLENVRGTAPSARLMIRIGAPSAGAALAEDSSYSVPVALFGLKQATASDGEHGGNGINVAVDITEIAGKLQEEAGASIDQLQVRIEQQAEGEVSPITVDRISIYKQPVG
jgi:tyrosinase